jgi:hypothetical protein
MPQILCRLISIRGDISAPEDCNVVLVPDHLNGQGTDSSAKLFKQAQSGKRFLEVIDFDSLAELVEIEGQLVVRGLDARDTRSLELSNPDTRGVGELENGVFGLPSW